MLQYDLTNTPLFAAESSITVPSDAEMFALTVALLVVHGSSYTDLAAHELEFCASDVERVAECIEYRLPMLLVDVRAGAALRDRLRDFVGLRIANLAPTDSHPALHPT